jgi:predicted anti-sigma-YlaC factor YlaD
MKGRSVEMQFDSDFAPKCSEFMRFQAHLEECDSCRQEFMAEEELSRLLWQARPLYKAPTSLRDRIKQLIAEE